MSKKHLTESHEPSKSNPPELTVDDLKKFCSESPFKWTGTTGPFTIGEYTYATNAKIIVRVPAIQCPEPVGRVPDPSTLNWQIDGDWKPLPHLARLETGGECCYCDHKEECPECVAGRISAELDGYDYACRMIRKIHTLPGPIEYLVKISKSATCKDEFDAVLHFRFPCGRGMLMPMHSHESKQRMNELVKKGGQS